MICLVNFFLFTKLHEAGSGLQELLAGQHEWDLAGKISYEILCRTLFVFFFFYALSLVLSAGGKL